MGEKQECYPLCYLAPLSMTNLSILSQRLTLCFSPRQLMMWTVYKREIMAREKEETDFLKKLFDQHKELNSKNQEDDVAKVTSYL